MSYGFRREMVLGIILLNEYINLILVLGKLMATKYIIKIYSVVI